MYDVAIIGAGPGGYVAGIRAAQLGLKACVIEKENPGGVCLNVGCIPTKNLIHQSGIFSKQSALADMGIKTDTSGFDYSKVTAKTQQAVQTLVAGVTHLLKKNKVDLIKGTAKITSKNTISLDDGKKEVQTKNIIIATGSRPVQIPGFEFDEKQVLSSTAALNLKKLPKDVIILGGGAIGCEFAHIMSSFGVKVTLVEMMDHLLPFEDPQTVSLLTASFEQRGITVLTKTRAMGLKKSKNSVTVTIEQQGKAQEDLKAENVLCVFGRTPNTENIGLENLGIELEKGCIPTGEYYQTKVAGIFAIGDVISSPQLAHVASKEGEIAVEYIAGHKPEPVIDPNDIISAIYCEPQIAGFGLRENQAKEQKIDHKVALFPYAGVGKAVAVGKPEGMVKILVDPKTKEILGAHIVGYNATELIHELLLAKTAELLPEDVAAMIHAHPTISEGIMEGMRAVEGQAIHC